ncbi:MAG TPA: NADPH:quinone oxidoreductase family protein [Mycobacteriales bacterium]|nr:NADPH:quinone oxidoreductase family protein [Mycobacteriales bacterium]
MLAARCIRLGPVQDVVVEDVPDPVPAAGEVVVAVGAAAPNFPDVLLAQGLYQVKLEPPFTMGSEFAGEVVALGEGVTDVAVGDRVRASAIVGAFAEKAVARAQACTPIADGVSYEAAAAYGVTYMTAYHALHSIGRLEAGQWVVVLGAAGGVGLAAVDLARVAGAHVVAAASSPAKLAACTEMGADVVVDYTRDDLKVAIKEATGGGAHLVVDPVGGAWSEQALRALRPGGRHVVVGFASGEIPKIPLNLLLVKGVSVLGLDLRYVGAEDMAAGNKVLGELLAEGRIHPHVGARYSLLDAREALLDVAERRAVGKVLVIPGLEA